MLPYRLIVESLKLVLLHGEVDALYRTLCVQTESDARLQEALAAFENAWDRQSDDWSQINGKEAIWTASLLAEKMLVFASHGRENEFTRALTRMRNDNRFPSNEFASIFDRAYTFANAYPNYPTSRKSGLYSPFASQRGRNSLCPRFRWPVSLYSSSMFTKGNLNVYAHR